MSLNFGPTPPPTAELAVLECLKIGVQSCDYSIYSAFIFDWIFIFAGNEDNQKSFDEFEFCQAIT